jgi:hypothetical protein
VIHFRQTANLQANSLRNIFCAKIFIRLFGEGLSHHKLARDSACLLRFTCQHPSGSQLFDNMPRDFAGLGLLFLLTCYFFRHEQTMPQRDFSGRWRRKEKPIFVQWLLKIHVCPLISDPGWLLIQCQEVFLVVCSEANDTKKTGTRQSWQKSNKISK